MLAVNGSPINVLGEIQVKFKDARPIPSMIVESMRHECLIGADALYMGNAKIDYETKEVVWFGKIYPFKIPFRSQNDYVYASCKETTRYAVIDKVLSYFANNFDTARPNTLGCMSQVKCTIPTGDHPPI